MPHTYAIDAANLVEECFDQLNQLLDIVQHQHHPSSPIVSCLYELEHVLIDSYDYIYDFIKYLIHEEKENYNYNDCHSSSTTTVLLLSSVINDNDTGTTTLFEMATVLKELMKYHRQQQRHTTGNSSSNVRQRSLPIGRNHNYYPNLQQGRTCTGMITNTNSTVDSLLFRLTVTLQLCLLRMNDARRIVTPSDPNVVTSYNNEEDQYHRTRQLQQQQQQQPPRPNHSIPGHDNDKNQNSPPQRRRRIAVLFGLSVVTTYNLPILRFNPKFLSSLLATISSSSSSRSYSSLSSQSTSLLTTTVTATAAAVTAALTQVGVTTFALYWIQQKWTTAWIINKLSHSSDDIRNWNQQWKMYYVHESNTTQQHHQQPSSNHIHRPNRYNNNNSNNSMLIQRSTINSNSSNAEDNDSSVRTRRLISHALQTTSKSPFWYSQGEIRFLMMKHAMDVVYASVGTAVSLTGGTNGSVTTLSTTMATAAAASLYYSVTGGASQRANEVISSSSQSARNLLQNAWGMMSLSGLKRLSLQASRLLKGAAVADRIEIAGVSCFVLSADPSPELAAAIVQSRKLPPLSHSSSNQLLIPRLSTIDEECDHDDDDENDDDEEETLMSSSQSSRKPFARCHQSYRQRDVILHLTGGGFFAHIIASDLPYLLDWSAATGAVVICPEYALLPEHTYPVALEQVERVYQTLTGGNIPLSKTSSSSSDTNTRTSSHILGFETNQIIITGESTGGNLAAALCVKIGIQKSKNKPIDIPIPDDTTPPLQSILDTIRSKDKVFGDNGKDPTDTRSIISPHDHLITNNKETSTTHPTPNSDGIGSAATTQSRHCRMPDALMLSCPILNLSLEMSHSRAVAGNNDPVLPSGLISAISDAYLPTEQLGIRKDYPLASPIYATDDILCEFPTTLLFASSTDPMLDDAVVFNQRLRYVGVTSELHAAQNLPHAYLGLGTAGFPEAKQVQEHCIKWLNQQLGSGCH